jgi:hypothetical protein
MARERVMASKRRASVSRRERIPGLLISAVVVGVAAGCYFAVADAVAVHYHLSHGLVGAVEIITLALVGSLTVRVLRATRYGAAFRR